MMQALLLYRINLIGSILSLLGSVFVLLLYLLATPLQQYSFKLVAWVSFFDMIRSICLLIPMYSISSVTVCNIYGIIYYQSILGSVFWTLAISISIYQSFILNDFFVERHYKTWLIFILVCSFSLSIIPAILNGYNLEGVVCEIKENPFGMILRLVIVIFPEFLSFCIMVFLYFKVILNTHLSKGIEDKESMKRFLIFPVIIVVCFLPILINSLLVFLGIYVREFEIFSAILFVIHGFLNSVFYGISKQVIEYIKGIFKKDISSFNRALIEI